MKVIFTTILVSLINLSIFAQQKDTINNFFIDENQKIVWQKIYLNTDISFEDIINSLKSNDAFTDIEINENRLSFWNKGFVTNPKALGFSRMTTAFYVLSNQKAFFTIDYKAGKYRITGINFSNFPPSINLAKNKVDYEQTQLESVALNRNTFTPDFIKKGSLIIDDAIQTLFKFSKGIDKNW